MYDRSWKSCIAYDSCIGSFLIWTVEEKECCINFHADLLWFGNAECDVVYFWI